ncbi:MAG: hypothetical protein JWN48_1259 [Myxococcaceae bacterium]|nr:hypothetical protein [Myxococcaceae bacterium]
MSEVVAPSAEQLVEQLAQIDVESCFEDPTGLDLAMAERQAILTALQNTDTSTLPAEQRARLKQRLSEVLARNGELLLKAGERLEELRKAIQQLAPARAAVRGYGEQRSTPPGAIKRVG